MMPTTYDHLETRCPRLGGEVKFSYCRRESGDMPCPRLIICWQTFFPAEQFLMDHMKKEDWERFSQQPPKDKVTTLIDLIEAAKKRKQQA